MRNLALTGLILLNLVAVHAYADTDELPPVTIVESKDLQAVAEQARERKLPIMLFFSQSYCPYCEIMKETYIKPILRSGWDKDRVIIRMVMTDNAGMIRDFNGERIDADTFTSRYKAYLTPTLAFVNANGKELTPRLMGIGNEYFFGGDIENAIETSLQKVRSVAVN